MNLDDLFGDGVDLAGDFLVKAQLKVRIKEHRLPVAQDLIRRLEEAYAERMVLLTEDLADIVKHADARKSLGLYVMDGGLAADSLMKAVFVDNTNVFKADAPVTLSGKPRAAHGSGEKAERVEMTAARAGSQGGKWYMTASGKIRYGTKPSATDTREATDDEVSTHTSHYRPAPFMGLEDGDQVLVNHIIEHGEDLGFTPHEAGFLGFWYGEKDDDGKLVGGDGLVGFIETFFELPKGKSQASREAARQKLGRDTLSGDLSQVKFSCADWGLSNISYEEAVMAFLGKQDYYGQIDDPETGEPRDRTPAEIEEAFHENVEPVLTKMFERFESMKTNPAVHEHMRAIAEHIEKDVYSFYAKAHDVEDDIADWSDKVLSMDSSTQSSTTLSALAAMDLIFIPDTGEVGKKAAHLKGAIAPNSVLLRDTNNPLLDKDSKRLDGLNTSQLILTYLASQLNGMFDSDTRKYNHEAGTQASVLGDKVFGIMADKAGLDDTSRELMKQQMNELATTMAQNLTQANIGKDPLTKKFVEAGIDAFDPAKAALIQEKLAALMKNAKEALAAQKDDNFALPKSMADGILGAVHHDDALDHHKLRDDDGNVMLDDDGNEKTFQLFKHQRQAINWMLKAKRGLLALDAGMGKTACVLTMCEHLREQGVLKDGEAIQLYLPPSVMNQWPSEIAKYCPGIKDEDVLNLGGMSLDERKAALQSDMAKTAKYIIISTGTLNGGGKAETSNVLDSDNEDGTVNDGSGGTDDELTAMLKAIPGPVFIDEVHTGGFKDSKTKRHQIANAVMEGREYSFGMTATPMPNGPMDLYHLSNLFTPGMTGDKKEWEGVTHNVKFNEESGKWDVHNPVGLMEMRERVRPYMMHKMITDPEVVADIGTLMGERHEDPDLRPIRPADDHPIYDYVKPGGKIDFLAVAMFQRMVKKAKATDAEANPKAAEDPDYVGHEEAKINKSRGFLQGMVRDQLRHQAEISPEMFDEHYTGGSPKIQKFVKDVVEHFKGGGGGDGSPVVAFCTMPRRAFALISRELVKAGIDPSLIGQIHGGKSGKERTFEQDMTNAGKRKILLVGTKSGGAGLNLQKASHRVMHIDQPMDPAAKRQSVARVHRPGQKKSVMESNYRMSFMYAGSAVETWDAKTTRNLIAKQAMVHAMMTDMDLTHTDFTKKTEASVNQLGLKSGKKSEPQPKLKMSPAIEHLASKIDLDSLLKGEDEGGPNLDDLHSFHDPEKAAKLAEKAPHLGGKMDVQEEKRVWNRSFDIQGMPSRWKLQAVRLATAKTPEKKAEVLAQTQKLVLMAQSYLTQIQAEAKVALDSGDTAGYKALTKQGDKFITALPDVFKEQPVDQAVAKMQADPTLAEPGTKAPAAGDPVKKTPAPAKKKKAKE